MKSPKKPAPKTKLEGEAKKPKLKPTSPKETKNWKNRLITDDDEDDDLDLPIDDLAFDDEFDEDEDF